MVVVGSLAGRARARVFFAGMRSLTRWHTSLSHDSNSSQAGTAVSECACTLLLLGKSLRWPALRRAAWTDCRSNFTNSCHCSVVLNVSFATSWAGRRCFLNESTKVETKLSSDCSTCLIDEEAKSPSSGSPLMTAFCAAIAKALITLELKSLTLESSQRREGEDAFLAENLIHEE